MPKSAETFSIKQLLSLALDWIEARVVGGQPPMAVTLHRPLRMCEPTCRAAYLRLSRNQPTEVKGPAGRYPLAMGLSLLSAACGKPWGFAAQPEAWTEEDWSKATYAVASLHTHQLFYRTGFEHVHFGPLQAT